MEPHNPMQATHTKQMVEAAGSIDVCSVCGEPANTNYFIKNAPKKNNNFATIKLCDDCVLIRRMTMDERLLKID